MGRKTAILEDGTKVCPGCNRKLPATTEFFFRDRRTKSGVTCRCKTCLRAYADKYNKEHPEWAKENRKKQKIRANKKCRDLIKKLKTENSCVDCGKFYHFSVMDFDHVRGEKKFNICRLDNRGAFQQLLKEIEKCEIVCSNCHRLRTYVRSHPGEEIGY